MWNSERLREMYSPLWAICSRMIYVSFDRLYVGLIVRTYFVYKYSHYSTHKFSLGLTSLDSLCTVVSAVVTCS
ncbi:hypothetical protein L596_004243 [Steinernema carpocapsae]|uniref:Uncharacterized protein n=1 Tax=Steinernema carpocapsae TaxID=34508 RepID=A0A4V6YSX3_STECR|nr:hypothetical protein L596_004243 [Steinernema carpocapsae]